MANDQLVGWTIWVEIDGRYRQLSVAESDRAEADKLALSRAPGAKIVHAQELPGAVIAFLKAERGQIKEWFSADPNSPIEPPSVLIKKIREAEGT
jgi:hypothetical protein